ncbi:MAG: DUF4157 domain-containing protein [Heteroscytonema crispum UTEX LB 1556]
MRLPIQPKLTIGQPNDQYEQEADRVAEQVMTMPEPAQPIQREMVAEEELETNMVATSITPFLQQSIDGGLQAESDLERQLNSNKEQGSPLPYEVRSFMEPRFGVDFSQVRVHTNNGADQMNQELNAQAFTHKQDIYFGSGKSPGKDSLTAHELTHVVQQTYRQNNNFAQRKPSSPSSKSIEVDLSSQNLYAFDKGINVYSFNCVSGDSSHPTPTGRFSVLSKHKTYTSKKYHAPMNYAMFFTTTGEAIHQSQVVGPLSYLKSWGLDFIGSHGCVRLAESDAATLFEWTPLKTPVWVH